MAVWHVTGNCSRAYVGWTQVGRDGRTQEARNAREAWDVKSVWQVWHSSSTTATSVLPEQRTSKAWGSGALEWSLCQLVCSLQLRGERKTLDYVKLNITLTDATPVSFLYLVVWTRICRAVLVTLMGGDILLVTDGNGNGSSISLLSVLLSFILHKYICHS